MTTLVIALALVGGLIILHTLLRRGGEPDEQHQVDYNRTRLLEHELMIAGHEETCPDCIEAARKRDYQRELEIARIIGLEAEAKAKAARRLKQPAFPYRPVVGDLYTDGGMTWCWGGDNWEIAHEQIEVTGFGDAEPHYVNGRRIK